MTTKVLYRRFSMTLDLGTEQKMKQLAAEQGQSVSSFVRYLIAEAFKKAEARKPCNQTVHDVV